MTNKSRRKPSVDQPIHSLPGDSVFLAPAPQGLVPVTPHLGSKDIERMTVCRHSVIPDVPSHYRAEPGSDFGNRIVHASAQLGFHFFELGSKPLRDRMPNDRVHSIASLDPADMHESEKVECFRLPLAAIVPVL